MVLGGAGRDEIFRIDCVTDRRVGWSTLPAADMCSFQHISAGCRKRFQVIAEKNCTTCCIKSSYRKDADETTL